MIKRYWRAFVGVLMIPALGFTIMWGSHDAAERMCADIDERLPPWGVKYR